MNDMGLIWVVALRMMERRDFPGGSVVKMLRFHCRGRGFDPWSGKIPHAAQCCKINK